MSPDDPAAAGLAPDDSMRDISASLTAMSESMRACDRSQPGFEAILCLLECTAAAAEAIVESADEYQRSLALLRDAHSAARAAVVCTKCAILDAQRANERARIAAPESVAD